MGISWSVVITTRNRAKMLRRAIRSCVEQTVPCEIVIVDEGSTDETAQVVREFKGVRYLRNDVPLGHSAAANLGMKQATGDWIKPLDDDDWLSPNCLETFSRWLEAASGFSPVLISGRAFNVNENEAVTGETRQISSTPFALRSADLLYLMLLDQAPLGTPVQVGHSRLAALEAGGWNERRTLSYQHGDETELWIKLGARGAGVFLPDFIGYRTIWPGGVNGAISHENRCLCSLILKDQIAAALNLKNPSAIRSYICLHWALAAVKERKFPSALKLGTKWAARPWSAGYLLRRRNLSDVKKLMEVIR